MISVLAQERLLGAALGCALTGIVVFAQRKRIYESIADHQSQLASQSQDLQLSAVALNDCDDNITIAQKLK
ncbi:hypothetical protein CRYUN_Cryun02cG0201300 [Craigia yunnanensis]